LNWKCDHFLRFSEIIEGEITKDEILEKVILKRSK
jgi:hypothetical protein